MVYSFSDLRNKEIISIKSGCRLGYPDDVEFDSCSAKVCRLLIYGRPRFFGLFGKCDDICVRWCDIEVIGEDTILVSCECPSNSTNKHGKGFGNLFK